MMKKKIIILTSLLFSAGISAQETLTLEQCREMALKYNKEMAASAKQTESARYTAKSYKGNFFPNFTLSGTGIYPLSCPMPQDSFCPTTVSPISPE